MNTMLEKLTGYGFDTSRLTFALRTALACSLAIVLAWLLGLGHPQWAGMTVWAASQPTRGHLIEKSFFRMAGTIVGSVFGTLLLAVSQGEVLVLVIGLSLWCALCTGYGHLQRGFTTYGTILAGYSAAMVALLGSAQPDHLLALGTDRMLTVLTGVVVALLVGWLFTQRASEKLLMTSLRQLTARVLRHVATHLRGGSAAGTREQHALLLDIAALEESLDGHGAGSLRARRRTHAIRALLCQFVPMLMGLKDAQSGADSEHVAVRLDQAAQALEAGSSFDTVRGMLAPRDIDTPPHPALALLQEGLTALTQASQAQQAALVVVHRDWVTARQAALRAGSLLLLVGLLWWLTGWAAIAYMMLGTSVMSTIFSTQENPARTMHAIIAGQIMGVAGALACRWLAWPLATTELELVLLIVPFSLLGAFIVAHPRTVGAGIDYNMVMLLLLQPALPLHGSFSQSLSTAAAVLCAPLLAYAAYRVVYPTDAHRRRDALVTMMVRELQAMAGTAHARDYRTTWRAQLHHRLLRLIAWDRKAGSNDARMLAVGATVQSLGTIIFQAQELLADPSSSVKLKRRLQLLLARIGRLGDAPERVVPALARTAAMLERRASSHAGRFDAAARRVHDSLVFFKAGRAAQ